MPALWLRAAGAARPALSHRLRHALTACAISAAARLPCAMMLLLASPPTPPPPRSRRTSSRSSTRATAYTRARRPRRGTPPRAPRRVTVVTRTPPIVVAHAPDPRTTRRRSLPTRPTPPDTTTRHRLFSGSSRAGPSVAVRGRAPVRSPARFPRDTRARPAAAAVLIIVAALLSRVACASRAIHITGDDQRQLQRGRARDPRLGVGAVAARRARPLDRHRPRRRARRARARLRGDDPALALLRDARGRNRAHTFLHRPPTVNMT